mgnify:CR=1 FL=1
MSEEHQSNPLTPPPATTEQKEVEELAVDIITLQNYTPDIQKNMRVIASFIRAREQALENRIVELAKENQDLRSKLEKLVGCDTIKRPKIICICGSSRFADIAAVQSWEFSKMGIITVSYELLPAWYWKATGKVGNSHAAEQEGVAHILDELHLRKIDLADEVFVINQPTHDSPEGYIGERTRFEINYALSKGKLVKYMNANYVNYLKTGQEKGGGV